MEKVTDKPFFIGIMSWGKNRSGLSFENRRITKRIDRENLDAFFYAVHDSKEVLLKIQNKFKEFGIDSQIIQYQNLFIIETERNRQFTEEHQRWYVAGAGLN